MVQVPNSTFNDLLIIFREKKVFQKKKKRDKKVSVAHISKKEVTYLIPQGSNMGV